MLAWRCTVAHACVSHLCQLNGYGEDTNEWNLPNSSYVEHTAGCSTLLGALFSTGYSTLFAGSLTSPRKGLKSARMAMDIRARLRVTPVPAERLRSRRE